MVTRYTLALSIALATTSQLRSKEPTIADIANGHAELLDLTWPLNDQNAFWPGDNYHPFRLKTIATLEQDGVLSKTFSMPEHLGTHIDAPNHFEANQPSVAQIKPEDLFAPGVVIDVRMQCEQNADFALTPDDLRAWEKVHGQIPRGSVVLLHTGWGRFWSNFDRYMNQDVRGQLHFPGFGTASTRFLVQQRKIRGLGIDTLSIDRGISRDFAVHHIVNKAGRYGLENVANLDQLPTKGFHLIVAPIRIEAGTGGPTRIFAVLNPTTSP